MESLGANRSASRLNSLPAALLFCWSRRTASSGLETNSVPASTVTCPPPLADRATFLAIVFRR